MSQKTDLAAIVEFLHRTDMIEKLKQSDRLNNTDVLLQYITSLIVDYNGDVDYALKCFALELGKAGIEPEFQDFDPEYFLQTQSQTMWQVAGKSNEHINKKHYSFELNDNCKATPDLPTLDR